MRWPGFNASALKDGLHGAVPGDDKCIRHYTKPRLRAKSPLKYQVSNLKYHPVHSWQAKPS